MTTATAERRIYVASLSDYNAGTLYGRWIDTEGETAETIYEQVKIMLAESPEAKLCQWDGENIDAHTDGERPTRCRGWFPGNAEEWAIHDHEGYPKGLVGEYTSFDELEAYEDAIADIQDPEAFEAFLGIADSGNTMAENAEQFAERYRGEFDSGAAYAEHFYDETGQLSDTGGEPHPLLGYIDWEAVWRGEFDCAGYHAEDSASGYYIFDESH